MMTKKEKLKLIEQVITYKNELDEHFDKIHDIFNANESPLFDTVWKLLDSYTSQAEEKLEDTFGMLSWYMWDNNCGTGGLDCEINKKTYTAENSKQLLKIIELMANDEK